MKLWTLFIAVVAAFCFTGCATTPLEAIYSPIKATGWEVAYAQDMPGKGNIIERIPEGETLKNWSKMITVQFLEGERRTPQAFMEGLKAQMEQRCPGAEWSVIESDNASVLYEWRIKNCPGQDDQHEVSRLLHGNDGLHRIAYVEKVPRLADDVREHWISKLKSAYLVKGGPDNPVVLEEK